MFSSYIKVHVRSFVIPFSAGSFIAEVNDLTPITEIKWLLKTEQLSFLKQTFKSTNCFSKRHISYIATKLNISEEIVYHWYKNHLLPRKTLSGDKHKYACVSSLHGNDV